MAISKQKFRDVSDEVDFEFCIHPLNRGWQWDTVVAMMEPSGCHHMCWFYVILQFMFTSYRELRGVRPHNA